MVGTSHIMMTLSPLLAALQAVRGQQLDHLPGLAHRAHERHHHPDVVEAHALTHALQRLGTRNSKQGRNDSST